MNAYPDGVENFHYWNTENVPTGRSVKSLSQNRRRKTEQKITAVLLKRSQWKFISSQYFLIKDIKQLISGYEQATKRSGSQISA